MTTRHRIAVAVAVAFTVLAGFAGAAVAAPAYPAPPGYRYYEEYADWPNVGSSVFIGAHATTNGYGQIWLNGTVSATGYNGAVVTWRGASGGGGLGVVTIGANVIANGGRSYWIRMDIHGWAGGSTSCAIRGNAPVMVPDYC